MSVLDVQADVFCYCQTIGQTVSSYSSLAAASFGFSAHTTHQTHGKKMIDHISKNVLLNLQQHVGIKFICQLDTTLLFIFRTLSVH